ncbi:trichohyalin-like isoform X2 [Apis laboriosa]|nr:trichohyalin-like isoform X2 [Apis laboriosa]XP_043784636.1 trichohyalin-like isoform X2 [Apis laboriosa]XP_043784637.1 trichohyalin-like isoform X2 [Apis laboriosa]XP_043784639.1 trichohyalin-like isoform X2 [Apis laboriosa]XP_043784640.1 trichohyalin-like isoform X2 [Apis laboriosa]XP_043784641.1 trichohyalin-like isoform X2 [Apis laboriosa]XP_043784642.1 trichohyalin-like isoform X2 [Apis laboriosa]
MQPGMRMVLATTFWLAVLVAGTVGHHPAGRLIFDQYSSPFDPHQYGVYRRAGGQADWKDQDPVEKNHPFDPSINPPRSITNTGHDFTEEQIHHGSKHPSIPDHLDSPEKTASNPDRSRDLPNSELPADDKLVAKKGNGAKSTENLSRLFEESFVADDTFQDQGPGSLEIYKLDLLRERPLLHGHQVTMFPGSKGKSKVPKKTSHAAWKTPVKTLDTYRPPPGLPMLLHKQSNSFDEPSTEVPPSADLFGVGGVPELQVGCEGLEAAHYKERRSIDGGWGKDKARDPWMLDVTPITLDLDYEGGAAGEEEEEEEEMDELLKLKRLETTTKGVKRNRGDMDAKLHSEFHSEKGAEKLPVRGDLGSSRGNGSGPYRRVEGGGVDTFEDGSSTSSGRGGSSRRILWTVEGGYREEGGRQGDRGKRALWGFGENEGVVSSDELQTENQRRRMYQEERRRKEEEEGRRRANSEIERIRGEYERRLDERQREEEERQRRLQESNRWQLEAEHRRRLKEEEERRREALEASRGRSRAVASREEEEARRRGRKEEEEEMDRRRLEERRREWLLKQRRIKEEEEEEVRRRGMSNLTYPRNVTAERERQRKLDEYVERNRPIEFPPRHHHHHYHHHYQQRRPDDPSMIDRRRKEEERKLLEYQLRRNQQVSRANDSYERNLAEQRRRMEEVRRIYNPGNLGRRNHGPSAPTNIDPRSHGEEARRREEAARRMEKEEEEERRAREERMREAERREEEVRRRMSRWYEEERRRREQARLEAERMAKVQREEEARRSAAGGRTSGYEDRRRFDDHRRRQDTGLIPAYLVLNKSRRPVVERARQRQEEVERRRQEEVRRAKEAREREERDRIMKEQWRRQEEARLNALPVSARIIVQPQKPKVIPRIGEFDFPGANPYQGGVQFPNFPAPPTRRPPVQSPPPCVWAVIQCCPSNQRLVTCFESLGCPGVNWDSNPCRDSVSQAARAQVEKFYRETEDEDDRY